MIKSKLLLAVFFVFCSALTILLDSCGNSKEISTKKSVISCQYMGMSERDGQAVVDLLFRNETGRDIQTVFGGLRVISRDSIVLQRTGFTYSRPWKAGEEKPIQAFAYLNINQAALQALTFATDYIPLIFELDEIVFADGESVSY